MNQTASQGFLICQSVFVLLIHGPSLKPTVQFDSVRIHGSLAFFDRLGVKGLDRKARYTRYLGACGCQILLLLDSLEMSSEKKQTGVETLKWKPTCRLMSG